MAALNAMNLEPPTFAGLVRTFWRDERGATMVEYAMLLALVSVVLFGAIQSFGTEIAAVFEATASDWGAMK